MADKKNNSDSRTGNPYKCPDFASIVKETKTDYSLFEQIASCFSERLGEFAVYYCKDDALGKDALQEAMLTALHHLDTYRGDSPIEPWLRRIVISSCSRLRRGKKNDPSVNTSFDAQMGDSVFADDAPTQEWSVMMAQSLEQVRLEIEKLQEPNKSLLMEHDVMGESIAKLANRFSLTSDAVKSRLKRSRAVIREALLDLQ
jgi:RNA polymerase sigma factor (sigma-70 family)